jgi:hypothetical protein
MSTHKNNGHTSGASHNRLIKRRRPDTAAMLGGTSTKGKGKNVSKKRSGTKRKRKGRRISSAEFEARKNAALQLIAENNPAAANLFAEAVTPERCRGKEEEILNSLEFEAQREQVKAQEHKAAQALALQEQADEVAADVTGIAPHTPFPVESLPSVVGRYVAAAAAAIGCAASFVALPLLVCLARAIGNRRVIRLKQSWTEPAILWAAIVGNSGSHKTPAMLASTRFVQRYEAKLAELNKQAMDNFSSDELRFKRSYKRWEKCKSDEPPPRPPEEPAIVRCSTTDITVEALVARLASQFDGLLVCPDELAGWVGGIAQYKRGKGSDLGFWLASWSGVPHTKDQKTGSKQTYYVPRASVCLVGGIQPGVLRAAIGNEHLQDGLCARLLLAWPPSPPRVWSDANVDATTEDSMNKLFERLVALEPETADSGRQEPIALSLTTGAFKLFKQEFNARGKEMQASDDDLRAALSKLEA